MCCTQQVSWASLWARSATIFSIVTICYIVLLYANRFNRCDSIAQRATHWLHICVCSVAASSLLCSVSLPRDKVASKPTQESDTSARITTLEPLNTGTNDKKESTVSISSAL
jgi:hypothetical protein